MTLSNLIDLFFGGMLLVLAVCWGLIWYEKYKEKQAEKYKVYSPPSEEVLSFGCHPIFVSCDYQQAAIDEVDGDNIKFSKTELYCKYIGKCVKIGSKCPYAQAHPDKLSKSLWS